MKTTIKKNIEIIFDRFESSQRQIVSSNFSNNTKPLYIENLRNENINLVEKLYGDDGVKRFKYLLKRVYK